LLRGANFDAYPIDYAKKFGEIAPQLKRELIPYIQRVLEQRNFNVTSRLIRDVLGDFHKNGRRQWKIGQLEDEQKKKKKLMGHMTNRLSEVNLIYLFIFFNIENY